MNYFLLESTAEHGGDEGAEQTTCSRAPRRRHLHLPLMGNRSSSWIESRINVGAGDGGDGGR